MMKQVVNLFIFLAFLSNNGKACECSESRMRTTGNLNKANYIALVRVKGVTKNELATDSYKANIVELTHYKGPQLTEIIVAGGHPVNGLMTSCDIGIDTNEEWIVFATNNLGSYITSHCTLSSLYRYPDGFRHYSYQRPTRTTKSWLDEFFQKEVKTDMIENGEYRSFFPNGKTERIENYKHGKLSGQVQYFYPNGNLYGITHYKNGLLHGKETWYSRNHAPLSIFNYTNGIKTDSNFSFGWCPVYDENCDNDLRKPASISIYDLDGCLTKSLQYSFGTADDLYHLERERQYDPYNKIETVIYYFENGKIKSVSKQKDGKPMSEVPN